MYQPGGANEGCHFSSYVILRIYLKYQTQELGDEKDSQQNVGALCIVTFYFDSKIRGELRCCAYSY